MVKKQLINVLILILSLYIGLLISEIMLKIYEENLTTKITRELVTHMPDPNIDLTIDYEWDKKGNSLLHIKSENKKLVYELRPNTETFIQINKTFVKTNSFGFRDYEFKEYKENGVYRIIVVGDSVTFGWKQEVNETYPKILEKILNTPHNKTCRFEVYNMGIMGYNSEQEIELIKTKVIQFNPDLIIVGYVFNDDQIGADAGLWRHFTKSNLRTIDYLKLRWLQFKQKIDKEYITTKSFKELSKISRDKEIPVLITIFPILTKFRVTEYLLNKTKIIEIAENNGFMTLNLLNRYKITGIEKLTWDVLHPNNEGHIIAAEEIYKFLNDKSILKCQK